MLWIDFTVIYWLPALCQGHEWASEDPWSSSEDNVSAFAYLCMFSGKRVHSFNQILKVTHEPKKD